MIELTQEEIWQQIDSAAYLFLNRTFEPRDNQLTIVLNEAIANEAKKSRREFPGGLDLAESTPIESTPDCRIFTLSWTSYVSYCVTEEMVGSCGDYGNEIYTGRLFRRYSKSNFLDFVARDTGAHFESYQHYKIACQNYVIDVAATMTPTLQISSRLEAESLRRNYLQ
ncbi:MAG: hypothetical protein JWM43_4132 [Acidobacteriaceae bacterium]|nr:hypothetical protein [Acidobacteriaceae bacterium]